MILQIPILNVTDIFELFDNLLDLALLSPVTHYVDVMFARLASLTQ